MTKCTEFSRRSLLRLLCLGLVPMEAGCQRRRYSESIPSLFSCDERELRSIGRSTIRPGFLPYRLDRNTSGDCAYLQAPTPSPGEILVLSATDDPRLLSVPGAFWALADDLKFVAWREGDEDGLRFSTGEFHKIPRLGMPSGLAGNTAGFSPGARYYFVTNGATTDVFATDAPGKRLAVAHLRALSMFSVGKRILVFGYAATTRDPYMYKREIVGEVYTIAQGTLRRERSIRIQRPHPEPSPFAVEDVDSHSSTALCFNQRDWWGPQWLLYDLASGNLRTLDPALSFGAFLVPSFVQSLYARLGPVK